MFIQPIASSSRLPLAHPTLRRTVLHHAKPPLKPMLSDPYRPKPRLPTSGPSKSHPPHLVSPEDMPLAPRSVSLDGTGLTLNHAPPPSAPTYSSGVVPDLLKWVKGLPVHLTGEEAAPRRREPREKDGPSWDEEVVRRIAEMRGEGVSRKRIALA